MFRSYSDNLQGAHMFLVKVTDFKICSVTLTRNIWTPWRWSE